MCYIFLHPSVDGHLGSVHVLAMVNDATVNTGVRVPFEIMVFTPGISPGVGLHSGGSSAFFLGVYVLISLPR